MAGSGDTLPAMDSMEVVYRDAAEYIEAGHERLSDLVDHCLSNSLLEEADAETGHGVVDTLIEILEGSGQYRVDEELDLVVASEELLEGLVLTHRLTSAELEAGFVEATPDLIWMIIGRDLPTSDGRSIGLRYDWSEHERYHADGSLEGEPGWLDGFAPGDLLTLTYREGTVHVGQTEEPADGTPEREALLAGFRARHAELPGLGFDVALVVDRLMMRHRELFRSPVPPITQLLEEAGLELDGVWVGLKGEDWEPMYVEATVIRARMSAESQGFSPCCVDGLETVVAYSMGRELDPQEVNSAMSHGSVATAFENWWMELRELEDDRLGDMLETLIKEGRRDLAGARYLLAIHHDARGDAQAAELQLQQAIAEDPEFQPGLWMLAGYASDRGQLRRAIQLWQRSGEDVTEGPIPTHQDFETAMGDVGRNDPCPCGSGRKFKQCHLHEPVVTDRSRFSWMLNKIIRYMNAHHRHGWIAALVDEAVGEWIDADEAVELWGDEFVADVAVFDDGILEAFIHDRADMLPADELAIFELWVGERLRCWEVEETDGVETVTLRDTATGDTVDVSDRAAAADLKAGDQILARALPAFGRHWLSLSVIRVDLRWRDQLISLLDEYPDAASWVHWSHSLRSAPTVTTTDGELLVFSSAKLRPATDWDELERELDDRFEPLDDDTWHDLGGTDGDDERAVRGVLTRKEEVLEVHTTSVERLDRILDMVGSAAVLVERSEVPLGPELSRDLDTSERGSRVELPAENRAELVERMEERWLGEPVPALGGLTPREAAADPTRREDLIALLRGFDRRTAPDGAMTFDVASLRRKLGIN